MTGPVRITVAIPAYNRPALLAETLESLVGQEANAFEMDVAVCDDLGLDETRRVVARFPSDRIAYHRPPGPPGAVANWNRCLRAGRGDWVMVLHEDDLLFPWYLRLVLPRLRDGIAAVCTRTVQGAVPPVLPAPTGAPKAKPYPARYFIKSSMTPFPGVLVRRDLALRLGGFDDAWGPLADYQFWYRLACAGPIEVVQDAGAFYRVAPGQWTEDNWPRMLRLAHLLRLRIAREQYPRSPALGRWLARFFTFRNARSYAARFPERPPALARALRLGRIPGARLPSGWVWEAVKRSGFTQTIEILER